MVLIKLIKTEMAGTILELKVAVGASVQAGQEVAVMESMKMEVPVLAPAAGKVEKIAKQVGDFANAGDTLMELA